MYSHIPVVYHLLWTKFFFIKEVWQCNTEFDNVTLNLTRILSNKASLYLCIMKSFQSSHFIFLQTCLEKAYIQTIVFRKLIIILSPWENQGAGLWRRDIPENDGATCSASNTGPVKDCTPDFPQLWLSFIWFLMTICPKFFSNLYQAHLWIHRLLKLFFNGNESYKFNTFYLQGIVPNISPALFHLHSPLTYIKTHRKYNNNKQYLKF